jgi:hypothetical protein
LGTPKEFKGLGFIPWPFAVISQPQVFHSGQLTGALLDRLTHHVRILTMNGERYWFEKSISRKKKQ